MTTDVNQANTFKLIRLWQGLTIAELATELGVADSTVSRVENGLVHPRPELRAKYARKFPVDEKYYAFVAAYRRTGA